MAATTMVVLLGGIIGADIAPSPTLATLPVTLMVLGLAIATIPAVMLMKKIGRKKAFIASSITAIFSTLLAAFAITQNNFFLFCTATFLLGTIGGFMQQYRFAALESVPKDMASKAVSMVLFSGILAGILGPEIAKHTKNLFSLQTYAGSFVTISILFFIVSFILLMFKDSKPQEEKAHGKERPLFLIVKQPVYLLSVLAGSIGYGVMVFIMSASPIHLHKISHFSLDSTAFVIQSHIVAMFLPSLVTGALIQKFGIFRILITGLVSFLAAVFISINAKEIPSYWLALVLLGIGWNFLFISSTVLLPRSYNQKERFKAQGINDFIVVISQTLGSFLAGSLLFSIKWVNLNLLALPFIVATLAIFVIFKKQFAISSVKSSIKT